MNKLFSLKANGRFLFTGLGAAMACLSMTSSPAAAVSANGTATKAAKHAVSAAVAAPHFFGSRALALPSTPKDSDWNMAVARDSIGAAAAAPVLAKIRSLDAQAKIKFVNAWVNRHVRFVDDSVQYGRVDVWSKASSTIVRKKGDCEDIAILKMKLLEAAGIPASSLYLSIVRDVVRHADHAVLVAVTAAGPVVLDNGGDALNDASRASDYRPMFTFNAKGRWTHGYART